MASSSLDGARDDPEPVEGSSSNTMAGIHDADGGDQASFNGTPPHGAKDDEQHLGDGTRPAVVDIIADVRERPSDTFEALRTRPDVVLTVATLEYGDYSVASQLSIERKAAEDLGRSIIDGRLFRQMSALRRFAARPVLLVEGLRPHSTPSGVPWYAVRGALVSVAVVFGVPIPLAEGPQESAEILVTAGRPLARTTSLAHVRPGYRPKGWRRRALFILQGLPNVGPAPARALLEAFGSVGAVMSAGTAMLADVEGIGVGAATSLARAIGDEPAQSVDALSTTPDREWPHRRPNARTE
jgi:ERCC4-type nuclease